MTKWKPTIDHQTVALTRSHYFDYPDQCYILTEGQWVRNRSDFPVLHPDVYWWLREHVGFDIKEAHGGKRIYYPDEKVPEITEESPVAKLCNSIFARHSGDYDHCRIDEGSIYFPKPRHAAAFRKRFGLWNRAWETIDRLAGRRLFSRNIPARVRELTTDITAIACHNGHENIDEQLPSFVTHSPVQRIYLITDDDVDHQRVMFMLKNQSPNPRFIVASEA